MTCDWYLDDTRQCHRPARALFADFLTGTRYHRCPRHDTRRKRADMSAAGFARYDVQKERAVA